MTTSQSQQIQPKKGQSFSEGAFLLEEIETNEIFGNMPEDEIMGKAQIETSPTFKTRRLNLSDRRMMSSTSSD